MTVCLIFSKWRKDKSFNQEVVPGGLGLLQCIRCLAMRVANAMRSAWYLVNLSSTGDTPKIAIKRHEGKDKGGKKDASFGQQKNVCGLLGRERAPDTGLSCTRKQFPQPGPSIMDPVNHFKLNKAHMST